jgi:glutathione S-transferase
MYPKFPAFCRWRERMDNLPTTRKLRAILPPRDPIPHAREWVNSHRPKY